MVHGWTRRWLSAAVAAAWGAGAAGAGDIRIYPTATVESHVVCLGDIAGFSEFEDEFVERLSDLVVYASPPVGGEALVRLDDVRGALADGEFNLAEIRLVGAARCRVTRQAASPSPRAVSLLKTGNKHKAARGGGTAPGSPSERGSRAPDPGGNACGEPSESHAEARARPSADAATLESYMRHYFEARVGEARGRVEVRFSPSCRRALDLDGTAHTFRVLEPEPEEAADAGATARKLGLLTRRVEVTAADGRVETVSIVAEALLVREVVVARSPINLGQIITGRMLKLEERKFDDIARVGLTDLAAALGQEAAEMVRTGDMLESRHLKARPIVRRGEAVTIWRRGGSLMIKTTGKAQSDGMLGQQIKVRRDGSRLSSELIDALVTGPGTVEVTVADTRQQPGR